VRVLILTINLEMSTKKLYYF